MIDLGKMIKDHLVKKDGEVSEPTVAALIVAKSDKDLILPRLGELGFKINDLLEVGDALVVKQVTDLDESACERVQLNDQVGSLLLGVQKGFMGSTVSTSFSENMQSGGFWNSIYMAMSTVEDTLANIMYSSDTPSDAAKGVTALLKDFEAYVLGMIKALPSSLFSIAKAEKLVTEVNPASNPDTGAAASKATDADPASGGGEPAKKSDVEEPANKEDPDEGSKEASAGAEGGDSNTGVGDIKAMLETMGADVRRSVDDGIKGLRDTLDTLSGRLDTVEKSAKGVESTVSGMLSVNGEATQEVAAKKVDGDLWAGTALDRLVG